MARRGFRIHSRALYDPFNYQELMAPIERAESAYADMQNNMLTLGEEANVYRQLIDTDPYASGILKGYNDTLENMSNTLSREGLKSVNRNTLLSLRRKYNNEVKPINDAAKTLAGIQDMYRQAYSKDNTLMRGAMPSIRDLVENPGAMPHMVSGSSLYNQGAQAAKSASGRKQNFSAKVNELVRGYIHTVNTTGYNSAEAQQFLDMASRQPELQAIVNQIYGANQVGRLDNPQQGMDWIVRGVFDGLSYDQKDDLKYDQYAAEMRAAARASAKTSGSGSTFGAGISPLNIYSQKEKNEARALIAGYQDFFNRKADGTWELSARGKKEKDKTGIYRPEHGVYGRPDEQNAFRNTMRKIAGDSPLNTDQDYINAWTKYYNEHQKETYDATKMTGYRYIPQSDDKTILLDLYKGHNSDGKIYTVDYDRGSNSFVNDKQINVGDVTGITDIEMTPVGFVVNASTKNGSVRLAMPDVGGPRLEWMQQQMFPAIDRLRTNLVETLQHSQYSQYARNPEQAMMVAQNSAIAAYNNGDMDGYRKFASDAQFLAEQLSAYEAGIQNLYDEMSNVYRATDAEVIKR